MRNLDIDDSRAKLDVYRNAGTLAGGGLMELEGSRARPTQLGDQLGDDRGNSRARSTIVSTSTYSWSAWAPPPTAPSPSRVGTPIAAVKLPSLPPPTATPCKPRQADRRPQPARRRRTDAADADVGHRWAVEAAGHLDAGARNIGRQRCHQLLDTFLLAGADDPGIDAHRGQRRHDVVGRASDGQPSGSRWCPCRDRRTWRCG